MFGVYYFPMLPPKHEIDTERMRDQNDAADGNEDAGEIKLRPEEEDVKTSSAKAKGRELQKHVAEKIRDRFDLPETDVQSRPMGSSGVDIMMSEKALKALPISIECKNTKTFPSLGALNQAKENALFGTAAAVCWKPPGKNPKETLIYFNLNNFLEWWHFNMYKKRTEDETNETEDNPVGPGDLQPTG
jgi:hypothetical protein